MSGRLVAAIKITAVRWSNPSISTSSWFSVCSRSSCPPPRPAPRWRPTASISSYARGADADEHLDEVRAADRVEGHAGLARDGAGEQRLAGAGRSEQEHALRDLGAHRLELGGVREVLLDLLELLDRLVHAGDVGERGLRLVLGDDLGARLAELHHAATATLRLVHDPQEDPDDQQDRDQLEQEREQSGPVLRVDLGRDAVVLEELDELVLRLVGVPGLEHRPVGELRSDGLVALEDLRLLDATGRDELDELRVRQRFATGAATGEDDEHPQSDQDDQEVDCRPAQEATERRARVARQGGSFRAPYRGDATGPRALSACAGP
jgi:hypothetical protein